MDIDERPCGQRRRPGHCQTSRRPRIRWRRSPGFPKRPGAHQSGAPTPLPSARLGDSDTAKIGHWAIAIGSPYRYEGSFSSRRNQQPVSTAQYPGRRDARRGAALSEHDTDRCRYQSRQLGWAAGQYRRPGHRYQYRYRERGWGQHWHRVRHTDQLRQIRCRAADDEGQSQLRVCWE